VMDEKSPPTGRCLVRHLRLELHLVWTGKSRPLCFPVEDYWSYSTYMACVRGKLHKTPCWRALRMSALSSGANSLHGYCIRAAFDLMRGVVPALYGVPYAAASFSQMRTAVTAHGAATHSSQRSTG
jgi:hypothetical protein